MSFWTDALGAEVRYRNAAGWRTRSIEAGDGPPVVMMGGLSGHAESFIRNVVPLADQGFRVYAIDCLGHGFTDKPLDVTYHNPVFIEHLVGFLDAIDAEKAHLVGQSLGGWIAWGAALSHPHRVGKLVSVTGAGFLLDDEQSKKESEDVHKRVRAVTERAVQGPTLASVRERLEWLLADPAAVPDELVETRCRIFTLPDSRRAMPKLVSEQPGMENRAYLLREDDLRKIRHQALIVWTDKNPTTPARVGQRVAELMPNGRFELITGAGHWPQFERAGEFNAICGSFLIE